MHKKLLKQISMDLEFLKTNDPAAYKASEERLSVVAASIKGDVNSTYGKRLSR